ESFLVSLTNVQASGRNVTITDPQGVGAIQNDDVAHVSINDVAVTEGNSGTTLANFTVTVDAAVDTPVSVDHTTANGTAQAGSDYTAANGTLTFAAGAAGTQTVSVAVTGDQLVELDETFLVNLTNVQAGGRNVTIGDAQGVGTIQNDDVAHLSINNVTVTEGNSGTTLANFTVTLDAAVNTPVTVDYATANGTAQAGSDYTAATGTLTFAAGTAGTQTVSVVVTGDQIVELDESFLVNLTNVQAGGRNVTIADAQGVGTIQNDDTAKLSINDVTVTEGNSGTKLASFTVTLDAAVDTPVSVDYATANGTAQAGSDYTGATGTLTFGAGAAGTKTVSVAVTGDQVVELDESFLVNLTNVQAGGRAVTIADPQGVGTIQNDDAAHLSINDVTVTEGNSGTTLANFTVTLDAAVDTPVSVDFATADVTAQAGSD